MKTDPKIFPFYGWIGFVLILVFWSLNWSLEGLRTHWGFFPMWLGYCLLIDALVFLRKGTSLLNRNIKLYIILFLISIPSWWLFEFFNLYTKNWFYDGKQYFTSTEYFLLSSLSFSIVMPAILGSAEFAGTFNWFNGIGAEKKIIPTKKILYSIFVAGFILIFLIFSFPGYFYPLIWLSVFLITEPVNVWLKNPSIFGYTENGDWRPVIALALGSLICGFFWEMWNYLSYPKWIYNLPMFNFIHIFEMPILGYIGYIPFSLEIFSLYHLITGFFKSKVAQNYIQINADLH
jgi:hypothetical protein